MGPATWPRQYCMADEAWDAQYCFDMFGTVAADISIGQILYDFLDAEVM